MATKPNPVLLARMGREENCEGELASRSLSPFGVVAWDRPCRGGLLAIRTSGLKVEQHTMIGAQGHAGKGELELLVPLISLLSLSLTKGALRIRGTPCESD